MALAQTSACEDAEYAKNNADECDPYFRMLIGVQGVSTTAGSRDGQHLRLSQSARIRDGEAGRRIHGRYDLSIGGLGSRTHFGLAASAHGASVGGTLGYERQDGDPGVNRVIRASFERSRSYEKGYAAVGLGYRGERTQSARDRSEVSAHRLGVSVSGGAVGQRGSLSGGCVVSPLSFSRRTRSGPFPWDDLYRLAAGVRGPTYSAKDGSGQLIEVNRGAGAAPSVHCDAVADVNLTRRVSLVGQVSSLGTPMISSRMRKDLSGRLDSDFLSRGATPTFKIGVAVRGLTGR